MRATRNFSESEFNCKCSKCNSVTPHEMKDTAMLGAQYIRDAIGRAVIITSGYRCKDHPVEAAKKTPGQHNKGLALDFKVSNGAEAFEIIKAAIEIGCNGFAYGNGFVHIDWRTSTPVTWRY